MSFLNIALLGGIAALAVPLIIHLLNRSRFRTVEWGAMHLLESVVSSNSRRIKIEQLILLLIRCAIPAMLAFCLARPVLTGWHSLPGDTPSSTVILLDNSYSMDAPGKSGTRLKEAVEDVRRIVNSVGKGSDVAVILTGGTPTPMFDSAVFDPSMITDQLPFIDSGRDATDWQASLELGKTILSGMSNARRSLIAISDFQDTDVNALTEEQTQRFSDIMGGDDLAPAITLIQRTGDISRNVAIESVELSTRALGSGQPLKVKTRVKNYGKLDIPQMRLQLKVDSQLVAVSDLTIGSEATTQAMFVHKFDKPGSHTIEVEVDSGDQLKTDDRYVTAVEVLDGIEVLLVDGDRSGTPMKSETDFLSIALTPFSMGRLKLADLVESRIVDSNKIDTASLAWSRIVILANVSRLDDERIKQIADFVDRGGGLIIYTGNKMNLDWYNKKLGDEMRLLPVKINGLTDVSRDDQSNAKIVSQFFDHPALQIFNSGSAELSQADFERWYQFEPIDEEATILMKLDSGDPLIVERPRGKGFVLAIASSADTDWNTLPLRPVFVPLIQQLAVSLTTRSVPETNLSSGQAIVAYFDPAAADTTQALSLPDGKQKSVRPAIEGDRAVVRYENTAQPGIYSLTQPETSPRYYAIETDRNESNTLTVDEESLLEFADSLGADIAIDGVDYLATDAKRRHGREIWLWGLFGLLGLMFGELFLQQRFARVRT